MEQDITNKDTAINASIENNNNLKKNSHTIKSVIVLSVAVFVAVVVLSLLNAFLPGYVLRLDQATKDKLNEVMHADDFLPYEVNINGLGGLTAFNKKFGNLDTSVKGVYKTKGGHYDGSWVIQTSSQGHKGNIPLIIVTAYTLDSTIIVTRLQSGAENAGSPQAYDRPNFYRSFEGLRGQIDANAKGDDGQDLIDISGASGGFETRLGYVQGVNLGSTLADVLNGASVADGWKDATGADLTGLRQVWSRANDGASASSIEFLKADSNFIESSGAMTSEDITAYKVGAIYKTKTDDFLVYQTSGTGANHGDGEGNNMTVMINFDANNAIKAIGGFVGNAPGGVNDDVLLDNVVRLFVGLTLQDIQGMTDDELADNTGATNSAGGIIKATINAFMMKEKLNLEKLV